MSIDFVALGNMVLVMRQSTNELSLVIMVLGWVCPISARVTQRGMICLKLKKSAVNLASDADLTTCLMMVERVRMGHY